MFFTSFTTTELFTRLKGTLLITFLSWIPRQPGILLRRFFYRNFWLRTGENLTIDRGVEFFNPLHIEIGHHVFLGHHVYLDASEANTCISLGDRVRLRDNVHLSGAGEAARIVLKHGVTLDRGSDLRALEDGYIEINDNVYLGPYSCVAGPGHIYIGKNCLIASHTGIFANNHIFDDASRAIAEQGVTAKGIVIEDDCWLGDGVKVLDGVTIGRGSVIGAGSVVTKSIPPFSVAVGVPAKVIKKRGSQQRTASLATR
ncbi:MAG: acyltransferase [Leptolyngbya sp. BL-A-14]